jgi:hypothetical protein
MKTMLRFSLLLNVLLLGGLVFLISGSRKSGVSPAPTAPTVGMTTPVTADPPTLPVPKSESAPFRWSQLDSKNDYRQFIANLRAIGCPESTIEDIVGGNVERAFAWKRAQMGVDDSGTGPWSRISEIALVGSLLGKPAAAISLGSPQIAQNGSANTQPEADNSSATAPSSSGPVYPLFLADNANWSSLGFDASEQAAIGHARQQFLNEINGANSASSGSSSQNNSSTPSTPDPNDPAVLQQWQKALQDANDTLQASLGTQDFATYEMQEYYEWYEPQVIANAGKGNLGINPGAYVPQ